MAIGHCLHSSDCLPFSPSTKRPRLLVFYATRPFYSAAMFTTHLVAVSLAIYPRIASGFSFIINNIPQQCSNLNISITGSGQPPYHAVILPYGPTPLPNNVEVREVIDAPFSGDSTSLSFKLTYPENSQFVVVVSNVIGIHQSSVDFCWVGESDRIVASLNVISPKVYRICRK
jgi:hypothetical protein